MDRRLMAAVLAVASVGAVFSATIATAVDSCTALLSGDGLKSLGDVTITSATTVSGTFSPSNAAGGGEPGENAGRGARNISGLPAFCRVTATAKPTAVSNIGFEIWLPSEGWNHKLQGVGNGGFGGTISYGAMAPAIKNGYAAMSTDDGHVASDDSWIAVDEKERDGAYRAIHEMTVAGKAITEQFYGSPAKISYFNGCSYGGSQGLGEAQLYPEDYDGILAGDPGNFLTHTRAVAVWNFQEAHKDPSSGLTDEALAKVTRAVLKACGGQYGESDGFLDDPRACNFDPEQMVCKAGQDPATCVTSSQAAAVKRIYAGPASAKTGKAIWPGLVRGSEQPAGMGTVGWQSQAITHDAPDSRATLFYSLGVFGDPKFDFLTADVETLVAASDKKFPYLDHAIANIEPYTKRGGKLLMYHGWADPAITPLNTINYYGSVVEAVQQSRHMDAAAALQETEKSVRLFLVPGMGHCTGGPGASTFDAMGALEQWVEKGSAPEKMVASHVVRGTTTFSRPLCAYPQAAQYSGASDRNDAANWSCVAKPLTYDSSFYRDAPKAR